MESHGKEGADSDLLIGLHQKQRTLEHYPNSDYQQQIVVQRLLNVVKVTVEPVLDPILLILLVVPSVKIRLEDLEDVQVEDHHDCGKQALDQ